MQIKEKIKPSKIGVTVTGIHRPKTNKKIAVINIRNKNEADKMTEEISKLNLPKL